MKFPSQLSAFSFVFIAFSLCSCGFSTFPTEPSEPPSTEIPTVISAPQAYTNFYDRYGYTWIDLRMAREVQMSGRVPGSINLP